MQFNYLMAKLSFRQPLLQSSVLHNPHMIYHSDLVLKKHLHLKKKHFFFIQLLFASHSMH